VTTALHEKRIPTRTKAPSPILDLVQKRKTLKDQNKSEAEIEREMGVDPSTEAQPPRSRRKPQPETTPHEANEPQFISLKELFAMPEEQIDWLVDGLLIAGGFSLLVAKPKVGKSTQARNLALSVAKGSPFLGRSTQQGLVVYMAPEEKLSEVRRHFRSMGATGDEPMLIFPTTIPALEQIHRLAAHKKPKLIIIDPLFRLARIHDGNDYAEVYRALEPIVALARETGAHLSCVHHAGKFDREGGDSILGSTALFAAVDTAIFLRRTERYRTIRSMQRYGEDLQETVLSFDSQTGMVSLGHTREQDEEIRIAEAMLEHLTIQAEDSEDGRPLTQPELEDVVEGRILYKRKALKALIKAGKVERTGKGAKGEPFHYRLRNS
jgi:predicted ATP-dependent serine protease